MRTIRVALALLVFSLLYSCQIDTNSQFELLSSSQTGITFNNVIQDQDSLTILNYEYIYNGGGVGLADFNNDERLDVFFTGNMVSNALYLNKGNMSFEDITEVAGLSQVDKWCTGVSIVDINSDGLMDIYVSASGHDGIKNKSNLLYVNQGVNQSGIPSFSEEAATYGIDDASNSTHSAFFDYDNDGDLDLIVIANVMPDDRSPSRYRKKVVDGSSDTDDHLYRNDFDADLNHPLFTEVSEEAGILIEGFSLGLNICDLNQDGWKDIYITNDYLSNDLLYINNQDGTFTNQLESYFKHTSFSAMGNDVIDLDNDGDSEIVAVEMLPPNNFRRKTMLPPLKYSDHLNNEKFGFQYQFVRNTLQQNNSDVGPIGEQPIFSDVAFMAGVAATDWSWTPLIADFDNDMLRDLIITNGFPKDVTDRDFIDYSNEVRRYASDKLLLEKVPSVKVSNYAFKNSGELRFEDVTQEWGMSKTSFSNGAAIGDLDNDGDLDYVVNNINDEAFIYRNNNAANHNWLRIKLEGAAKNPMGLGALVKVYSDSAQIQTTDFTTYRGYLSSHEPILHFGLNDLESVDSVVVKWPDGQVAKQINIEANQNVTIKHTDSNRRAGLMNRSTEAFLVEDVGAQINLTYEQDEIDFTDYNVQPLLIHKLSQFGPALSIGDVNSDGLEDLFISGSRYEKGVFFVQQDGGSFEQVQLIQDATEEDEKAEELSSLFFDADGDGDQDFYVTHGGYELAITDPSYADKLYMNEGGQFIHNPKALPSILVSSICVRAADFDGDSDLDLFVGGRVSPFNYPEPVSSYVLRNDTKDGVIKFTDVTTTVAPSLDSIGMVTDALWTDFNQDGQIDLLLSGEFMPLTFIKNVGGRFEDVTSSSGVASEIGWWNSITAGDYDRDGDMDYVVGNHGNNIVSALSNKHPLRAYFKDFDENGNKDLLTTCYFPDENGIMKEFSYYGSSELVKQYNVIRSKFTSHSAFAAAEFSDVISAEEQKDALILEANNFNSSLFVNDGQGRFTIQSLPAIVQKAPVFGLQTTDVNADGFLDVIVIGNDHSVEVSLGRLDAHDGLIGLGNGVGSFDFKTSHATGFFVPGDAKALVSLTDTNGESLLIASQNKGALQVYRQKHKVEIVEVQPDDSYVLIEYLNGDVRREELYYGNGFISQSSRSFKTHSSMKSITIFNVKNEQRVIQLK